MYVSEINAMLKNNQQLREQAEKQWSEYNQGISKTKPSVELKTFDMIEQLGRNINGDFSKGTLSVRESLTSTDVVKLIPKVIEGKLREAAEPVYLATNFMKKIKVDEGPSATYVIPIVGELYAYEVAEGARYNESSIDMGTLESSTYEIRVRKFGLKVSITEEAVTDGAWDIMGINISKAGRAMARLKEELCLNNFSDHGHVVFDNAVREQNKFAGTTGRDQDGNYNDTMSTEDFLDLMLAMMGNNHTPTDVIMHPLTWVVFARNSMIGNGLSFGAFGGSQMHPWGATQGTSGFAGLSAEQGPQKFIMTPEQVQGRLPFSIRLNFSPFVRFDKKTKRFDMYAIDANEVGIIAQKEELTTENWTDPERDVRLIKCRERYGVGILDNGRGIAVARNIAVAPTYPVPPTVSILEKKE